MLQTLLIGGVVCTALSMSGSLVTQYKIGYWLGATPRKIEISNIIGCVAASAATTAVILLMAKVYGFSPGPGHPHPLPAPQPNAMAAVLRGIMGDTGAPWFLYGIGGVFAVSTEMCGVSGLAFALGMYLPMELNSPLVYGAAHFVAAAAVIEGSKTCQGTPGKRNADCIRLHCRRSAGRRAGSAAAIHRRLHGQNPGSGPAEVFRTLDGDLGQLDGPRDLPRPWNRSLLGFTSRKSGIEKNTKTQRHKGAPGNLVFRGAGEGCFQGLGVIHRKADALCRLFAPEEPVDFDRIFEQ